MIIQVSFFRDPNSGTRLLVGVTQNHCPRGIAIAIPCGFVVSRGKVSLFEVQYEHASAKNSTSLYYDVKQFRSLF